MPQTAKLRVEQELTLLATLTPLITAVETQVIALRTTERWRSSSGVLIQLPGIGVRTTMIILSAIGAIGRFPSAKHGVGYSGLGAGIYARVNVFRTKGITTHGRRELRTVLVEAA